MSSSPIYVTYAGKCLKSRDRQMLKSFLQRFYTPFAFVVWVAVAFNFKSCANVPVMIATVTVLAASTNAIATYQTWLQDVYLLSSGKTPTVRSETKTFVIVSDFFIHFVCTLLSFWWIDDFHECIPVDRHQQATVWSGTFLIAFLTHYIRHSTVTREKQRITANAYQHVSEFA